MKITRRDFLQNSAYLLAIPAAGPLAKAFGTTSARKQECVWVNDIHSQLNRTCVESVVSPRSGDELIVAVKSAIAEQHAISISGGRHAMGGQQFGSKTMLLDMRQMTRVLDFDRDLGQVEVEAGIEWPALVEYLLRVQKDAPKQWGITQKQTGADNLTIGGALSANVHGRGLKLQPIVGDVESFKLVTPSGELVVCSRQQNADIFKLVIGGYGLFGILKSVRLRLSPRRKLRRDVKLITVDRLIESIEQRVHDGYLYGDCQFAIDPASPKFLHEGVFSCYLPVPDNTPLPETQKELAAEDWDRLYYLAHTNPSEAFEQYSRYYLSTSGQIYWSDTHQLSVYVHDYHRALNRRLGDKTDATEMITEIYVPRNSLSSFLQDVRQDFIRNKVKLIYGTIRFIEKDDTTYLPWARDRFACIVFNLHVPHTDEGLKLSSGHFRRLIDLGIKYDGSYYLTYHRFATQEQILHCYPQFVEFLRLKKKLDPHELIQTEWYRFYQAMFSTSPGT